MSEIILVLDNVRSVYNVGSLLRTADGLGLKRVITVGYTPTVKQPDDKRLPHVITRVEKQLAKTALGAEGSLDIVHFSTADEVIKRLKEDGYIIAVLEQANETAALAKQTSEKLALVVGNEVDGVSNEFLTSADIIFEIPMKGTKNSLNVSVAGAIAMHTLTSVDN